MTSKEFEQVFKEIDLTQIEKDKSFQETIRPQAVTEIYGETGHKTEEGEIEVISNLMVSELQESDLSDSSGILDDSVYLNDGLPKELDLTLPPLPQLHVTYSEKDEKSQKEIPPKKMSTTANADLETLKLLGEGGMGQVFLARQRSLKREIAIKRIKPDQISDKAKKLLLHEGLITGFLEHPNIIPVHAMGYDENQEPLFIMKKVEGTSWSALLKDPEHPSWDSLLSWSNDPLTRNLEILMEICNALHFAHCKGIVHRDIKPENIMIGSFGEVYLLDWGIATKIRRASKPTKKNEPKNKKRSLVGTPCYMAPEMLIPDGPIDERTDVYLLGATLHEILTGEYLHKGLSIHEVLYSVHLSEPKVYPKSCQYELASICQKATSKEPRKRFTSVWMFRSALASFLRHQGSVQLTEVALQKLQKLQIQIQYSDSQKRGTFKETQRLFTECRFSFQQALTQWPGNAAAQKGIQSCINLMLFYEIQEHHLDSAQALFSELDQPAEKITRELKDLEQKVQSDQEERASLELLKHDLNFSISLRQRLTFVYIMAFFALIFGGVVGYFNYTNPPTYFRSLIANGTTLSTIYLTIFLARRSLFKNEINKRFSMLLMLIAASTFIHRIFASQMGIPISSAFASELFIMGAISASASIAMQKWWWWIASVFWSGAFISMLFPSTAGIFIAICPLPAWLICGVFWSLEVSRNEKNILSESK